jgi:hypothetical protein
MDWWCNVCIIRSLFLFKAAVTETCKQSWVAKSVLTFLIRLGRWRQCFISRISLWYKMIYRILLLIVSFFMGDVDDYATSLPEVLFVVSSLSAAEGRSTVCVLMADTWKVTVYILYITHSWSWALLEKPPIVLLLKNFPEFYGTRRFITVFTRALH